MTKVVLGIEYDGSAYCGWQAQAGVHTIQEVVEQALSRVANEPISVVCAGRTDRGVHALEQVAHFETKAIRRDDAWVLGTNTFLPKDITIRWARKTTPDFHARFSALRRHYRYLIINQNVPSALFRQFTLWHAPKLNAQAMHEGAQHLLGEHDFSAFRGADCQSKSAYRQMEMITITRQENLISIDVIANAFLHHMVRNIVGSLLKVGSGRAEPDWIKKVLMMKDRAKAGVTAPPEGLCLMQVHYPSEFNLPHFPEPWQIKR